MRKDPARNLGRTQTLVLHLLASNGSLSAEQLHYHWWSLTESAARSAVKRLADRSLVDVAGWDQYGRCRTYSLTAKGAEVERGLVNDSAEELA